MVPDQNFLQLGFWLTKKKSPCHLMSSGPSEMNWWVPAPQQQSKAAPLPAVLTCLPQAQCKKKIQHPAGFQMGRRPSYSEDNPYTSPLGPQQRCYPPHHSHSVTKFRLQAPVTTTFSCRFCRFSSSACQQRNCTDHSKAFPWSSLSQHPFAHALDTQPLHHTLMPPSAMLSPHSCL